MPIQRVFSIFLGAIGVFFLAFFVFFMCRDPWVDLSAYHDVVPHYKAKIKELRVATRLLDGGVFALRHREGVSRLEVLAQDTSPIAQSAKKTLYYYYGEPERWQCAGQEGPCLSKTLPLPLEASKKAFFWARQLEDNEKTHALVHLFRDGRVAPVANEEDRIHLIYAAEAMTELARQAALALAYHQLDKRYFPGDMIGEANLWLDRAAEIDNFL